MGGGRRTGIVGLCLLSACVFESASPTNAGMLEDTDASSSTSGMTAATSSNAATTSGTSGDSQGGTGGSSSGQASSEGADETMTPVDPSEGNPPRADLVFVQDGPIDLGVHPLGGPTVLTLQLTNAGEGAAAVHDGDVPPSPLRWAGDAFPGTDGTCEGVIAPGDTCTVTLSVGPGQPGYASGPLAVHFGDNVGTGTASVPVDLTATGRGPNLIQNPDAESDPEGVIVTGWDAEDSSFRTTTEHNHGSGSLSFFGGGSENPAITQDVVLGPWSDSIDDLGLRFVFTGWTRSRDSTIDDDPHRVSLTFIDGAGEAIDSVGTSGMTHDGWEDTNFDVPLPPLTRRVRIRLSCDRNDIIPFNSNCSAWFDDFAGALAYEPE